jgi:hypothetical protein
MTRTAALGEIRQATLHFRERASKNCSKIEQVDPVRAADVAVGLLIKNYDPESVQPDTTKEKYYFDHDDSRRTYFKDAHDFLPYADFLTKSNINVVGVLQKPRGGNFDSSLLLSYEYDEKSGSKTLAVYGAYHQSIGNRIYIPDQNDARVKEFFEILKNGGDRVPGMLAVLQNPGSTTQEDRVVIRQAVPGQSLESIPGFSTTRVQTVKPCMK